jgi:hypothetical protein
MREGTYFWRQINYDVYVYVHTCFLYMHEKCQDAIFIEGQGDVCSININN